VVCSSAPQVENSGRHDIQTAKKVSTALQAAGGAVFPARWYRMRNNARQSGSHRIANENLNIPRRLHNG